MRTVFQAMAGLLQNQESFVVVTIFDKTGSVPRTAGAKMVVRQDGSIAGTIGGGRLEADAIKLAREVMTLRQSLVEPFNLSGEDVAGMDKICGGQGEMLLDFIDAHLHDKTILEWSLTTGAGYIGMIGSRRKRDKIMPSWPRKATARSISTGIFTHRHGYRG